MSQGGQEQTSTAADVDEGTATASSSGMSSQQREGQMSEVPWLVEGVNISPSILEVLYVDYPNLDNEADLAQLLEELTQMFPSYDLSPSFDGKMWLIRFQKQPYVDKIVIDSDSRLPGSFASQLEFYIGTLYSAVVQDRFQKSVKDLLKKRGYYAPVVSINQKRDEARMVLEVDISSGNLCYIEKVKADFVLPKDIESIRGSVCSNEAIKGYFDEVVEHYQSEHYVENTFALGEVKYNPKTSYGTLEILGSPGPMIEYVFSLDKDTSDEEILDILSEISEEVNPEDFSPYLAISEINSIFFDYDYHLASTSEPRIEEKEGVKQYVFVIRPGAKISKVEVELIFSPQDQQVLSQEEIEEELETQSFFPFLSEIQVSQLPQRIAALTRRYRNLGYWDVIIDSPKYEYLGQERLKVVLGIQLGKTYHFSSIEFKGHAAKDVAELSAFFDLSQGDLLDQSKMLALRNDISNAYIQGGYLDVEVKLSIKKIPSDNGFFVDVVCEIDEGRKFLFGDIFIFGLTKTSRDIVIREIDFETSEDYSPEKIQNTYRRIVALGLFSSVKIIPRGESFSANGEKIRDIFIIVKEGDNGLISFGPGYDFFDGYNYLIEASYNNVLGLGRKVFTRLRVNQGKRQIVFRDETLLNTLFNVGYKHPYFLSYPLDFSVLFTYKAQADVFWQLSTVMQEDLSYVLFRDPRYKISLFTRQALRLEIGSREQLAYYLSQDEISILSVGLSLRFDLRDNPPWPKKGTDIAFEYERAFYFLNFDTQFDKIDMESSFYQPLTDSFIYQVGVRWTTFWSIGRKTSTGSDGVFPISEMLQAGGTDLVRGFAKDLGPYVAYPVVQPGGLLEYKKDVVGGTSRLVFKQKLRYLISNDIAVNLFYDMGNSYLSKAMVEGLNRRFLDISYDAPSAKIYHNYPLFDSTEGDEEDLQFWQKLYAAAGLALDYFTPIGSLRLSAAHPTYQPGKQTCDKESLDCLDRRNPFSKYFARLKFDLTIAARF